MIIDTHCHLTMDAFDLDREAVIARAREHGVQRLINVGIDPASNQASWQLAQAHDFIFHTAGFHPHSAEEMSDSAFEETKRFVEESGPVAIGEIGLDYVKSESSRESQKKTFVRMIHLAREKDLPLIVHSRNAPSDTIEILKTEGQGKLRGVIHCFSYDEAVAKAFFDLGFLISFTCNITFKNGASLLAVAKSSPLDKIMLETDSPYLAPQIYRGKRNEPSCLRHLVDFLAEHRQVPAEEVERVTSATATKFFGLKEPA